MADLKEVSNCSSTFLHPPATTHAQFGQEHISSEEVLFTQNCCQFLLHSYFNLF
jgi:hypothetical protein